MPSPFRYLTVLIAMAAAVVSSVARADQLVAASVVAADAPRLFDSREVHSTNLAQFKQWRDVMARWQRERSSAAKPCPDGVWTGCEPKEWGRLVRELRQLPPREQIERVNTAFNRHPYVPSYQNWGAANYWETPFEFLRKNGQCQDYAIAKFMLLRALGVPNEQLRIVVLRDTVLELDHAVVVAFVGGEALVLDNQIPRVVPVSQIQHYQPYYSTNETGWWLHVPNPLGILPPVREAANHEAETTVH